MRSVWQSCLPIISGATGWASHWSIVLIRRVGINKSQQEECMSTRDLGVAEVLGAEAIGRPGERRFRLFARTKVYSALFWMEKEQLLNLALIIDRILAQTSEGRILRVEAEARA